MFFSITKIFILLMISITSMNLSAQSFESSTQQVHLIELYTSEGCHSCPPADKWFSKLKSDKNLWKTFVPVGFHVDYWNYLGWDDPLSDVNYSQRQRLLAKTWVKPRVYTPGFTLNAKEFKTRQAKSLHVLGAKVGKLTAKNKGGKVFEVSFAPAKDSGSYRLFSTLLTIGTKTSVETGENSGKKLKHDFGVCKFDVQSMKKAKNAYIATVEMKNCDSKQYTKKAKAAAFWVSAKKDIAPIQAVGGYLK